MLCTLANSTGKLANGNVKFNLISTPCGSYFIECVCVFVFVSVCMSIWVYIMCVYVKYSIPGMD